MTTTVARLLADSLEAHDVDQIFCVPGESYVGLTSVLTERNSIRMIVCRHEGGAGFMAAADGRLRNRAGVCIVSRGPGLANAMVSLHSAYHDATPMVMMIGQVERKDFGRLALQEQNYSKLLSDITKSVIEVNEPEMASEAIARAFHVAESGTPGPVAVVLPEDIFDEATDAELNQPRPRVVAGPRPQDLQQLAAMLAKAERPLILCGGALLADSLHDKAVYEDLRRFSETWVVPINPTHRRPQLFDTRHPNYGGYMGIRVPPALISEMRKADLIVALGERLTDTVSQSYSFPAAPQPQLPLVHVWPDPNEVGRVWRVDLGMPCDPHEVLKGLLALPAPADAAKRRGWVDGLHKIHLSLLEKTWEPTTDGINFAAIVCEIDKHLADDAVITSDAGNFGSYLHRYINFRPGQEFLSSVVGAMGSGMPMAVAGCLRRPGRQVVAFMGDGGALMMGNEIATACQYGGNPIVIISDNSMYGTIGMHSYVRYPERKFMDATRLTNPDFAAWGRSFGAEGITIREESEIAGGIAKAFAVKTKPVVVHCLTSALQMSAWRRYQGGGELP
ncbi:thiamine pyrophosphate-dependent enzyme [Rhodopila sp.]|jgi:acetolactate synthase-1/2/3 large subunit|uniref:thiamine pyrophosphate-dependent enzyme n=1 Tax=Rhodopila sp. TaxID=2480087 RepID=UPI002CB99699|nr:thiamine pyrophosphate-dependent enzyme [Rhodopila sp.]HVZ10185.1 thiamine pyrophosphate-dependent enzyme [Rhodopila sp.]